MTGLKADNHPSNLFRVWSEVLALPLLLFVQGNYWFMYFYVHAFLMLAGHAPREYSEKGREGLQQSPDLREKKSRQDMMSKREYRENIATHALAAKLLMKDESTTLEVVS